MDDMGIVDECHQLKVALLGNNELRILSTRKEAVK
jgi:hypothetical protein